MNNINEHILKLSGFACLPKALEYKRYMAGIEFDINKISKKDRQDGSFDFEYKGKMTGNLVIRSEEKKIYGTGKKSPSSKLRARLWHYYRQRDYEITFDQFYAQCMFQIYNNIDIVLEQLQIDKVVDK